MTPPLVVFDVGATLVSGPSEGPAKRIAREAGLDDTQAAQLETALMTRRWERPEQVIRFVEDEMAATAFGIKDIVEAVWSGQESEAFPIEGAEQTLSQLVEARVEIGIASNIWHPFLIGVRKHFGNFFDDHVRQEHQAYSYREGVAKPSSELLLRVLNRANPMPRAVVMVGDSYVRDIEPALQLGIYTIWVLHRPAKEVGNIVRVLNGKAACPSRTVSSISSLDADMIGSIIRSDGARAAFGGVEAVA